MVSPAVRAAPGVCSRTGSFPDLMQQCAEKIEKPQYDRLGREWNFSLIVIVQFPHRRRAPQCPISDRRTPSGTLGIQQTN
jgi:hypothetical protein